MVMCFVYVKTKGVDYTGLYRPAYSWGNDTYCRENLLCQGAFKLLCFNCHNVVFLPQNIFFKKAEVSESVQLWLALVVHVISSLISQLFLFNSLSFGYYQNEQ